MSGETISAEAVVETDFGEKVALQSPYEAKDLIKHMPWKEYADEVREFGSLKAKAESRGTNTKTSELTKVFQAYEKYGFSANFATHVSWNPDALGAGSGAWTIDREAWGEASDFFEFAGYEVESATGVGL